MGVSDEGDQRRSPHAAGVRWAAGTPKAMNSGGSLTNQLSLDVPMPITCSTTTPTSYSAMCGIVARIPVRATASASTRLS